MTHPAPSPLPVSVREDGDIQWVTPRAVRERKLCIYAEGRMLRTGTCFLSTPLKCKLAFEDQIEYKWCSPSSSEDLFLCSPATGVVMYIQSLP
ncbi:hypothetical protein GDO81_026542 [Engystomops pustulosus]|uniref:Uncharacterized protein n=1 Tax=Engystomops pustulosus TaxID=76066 RepID=A0AAV6ZTN7_ENGPU|nr:hypothetical protein GDO81_026542 [Engystomops pustulosus]